MAHGMFCIFGSPQNDDALVTRNCRNGAPTSVEIATSRKKGLGLRPKPMTSRISGRRSMNSD